MFGPGLFLGGPSAFRAGAEAAGVAAPLPALSPVSEQCRDQPRVGCSSVQRFYQTSDESHSGERKQRKRSCLGSRTMYFWARNVTLSPFVEVTSKGPHRFSFRASPWEGRFGFLGPCKGDSRPLQGHCLILELPWLGVSLLRALNQEQQKEGNAGPGPGSRVTAQGSDLSAQLGGRGWGGLQLVWVGLLGEPLLGSGPLTS